MGDEAVSYRGAALPRNARSRPSQLHSHQAPEKRSPSNGRVPCTLRLRLLSEVSEIVGDGILRTLIPYHSRLLSRMGALAGCLRLCCSEVSRPTLQEECNQHLSSLVQFAMIPLTSGAGPTDHRHVVTPALWTGAKANARPTMWVTRTVRSPYERSHAALPHGVQGTGAIIVWS